MRYDLTILGNDEAAFETAIEANQRGLKTLVVVSESTLSSWLETKALQNFGRELLAERSFQSSVEQHGRFGPQFRSIVRTELQDFNAALRSRGIDVLNAHAEFDKPEALILRFPDFSRPVQISSSHIVVATGVVRTAFPPIPGKEHRYSAHSFLDRDNLPTTVRVVGGNDFGASLAACLQIAGTRTQLIARTHCDSAALELAAESGVDIADHPDDFPVTDGHRSVKTTIDCRGRIGQTQGLKLANIEVEADEHGQLWCGRHFETWCRGVYGVGDVVGFSPDSSLPAATQAKIVVDRIIEATSKSGILSRTAHTHSVP